MQDKFTITTFNNINDSTLKTSWCKIQKDVDVFPQMYYEWIAPWWEGKNEGRELYVILVFNSDDEVVGLAPFCVEKKMGVRVLQSLPVHFGDYYTFIIKNNELEVFNRIIDHINSFSKWSYVKLNLVRSSNAYFEEFKKLNFKEQLVEHIIEANLAEDSFDNYLLKLHRKVRGEFRRRLRKLEELGEVEFVISSDPSTYIENEEAFKRIYELRWKEIDKVLPGDEVYKYRRKALTSLATQRKAVFVLLKLNDEIIAYRFGLLHESAYHDYKISFNPEYHKYGLGSIITGLLIKELYSRNIKFLDHGIGDYSYKKDWSPNNKTIATYNFHHFKKTPMALAYYKFETEYKGKIKKLLKK